MKNIFFHSKVKYIVCLSISLIGILVYVLGNDPQLRFPLISLNNACFIVGFIMFLVGCLSIVASLGAFDIFSYQFKRKGSGENKYTLYDHQQKRMEKSKNNRYSFVPYMVVGGFFVIVSLILSIIYSCIY